MEMNKYMIRRNRIYSPYHIMTAEGAVRASLKPFDGERLTVQTLTAVYEAVREWVDDAPKPVRNYLGFGRVKNVFCGECHRVFLDVGRELGRRCPDCGVKFVKAKKEQIALLWIGVVGGFKREV